MWSPTGSKAGFKALRPWWNWRGVAKEMDMTLEAFAVLPVRRKARALAASRIRDTIDELREKERGMPK